MYTCSQICLSAQVLLTVKEDRSMKRIITKQSRHQEGYYLIDRLKESPVEV
jgi:hypothetical protein